MTAGPPANPPAHWYPDPTDAGSLRYWDGGSWTAHTYPAAGYVADAGQAAPAGLGSLAMAVRVLVGLCGLAALFDLGVQAWGGVVISAAAADPAHLEIQLLDLYDLLDVASVLPALALALAAGVVWLVWQHRLASTVPRAALRRSPGWHVWSWLIPIVNLLFPFQNMADLHRALTPVNGSARAARLPLSFRFWWLAWLASSAFTFGAARVSSMPDVTLATLAQASVVAAIGDGLEIIAAVLAIRIVGQLSRAALLGQRTAPAQLTALNAAG